MSKRPKTKPSRATALKTRKPNRAGVASVTRRVTSGRGTTSPPAARSTQPAAPADLQTQVRQILRGLAKTYPDATCALTHESPYQLLVATILSAQCTDERVNMVTPALFQKYPDIPSLAAASQGDVEAMIRSTGFFRAKATSLRGMAQAVVERFGGQIPRSLDDLVTLPGVGRKTANVLLGTAWHIASGVVVDTHVKRLSTRLGLTTSNSAEQIERDLMQIIPQREWVNFSHRLIHHGRRICFARKPKCLQCPLLHCCRRVGLPPLDSDS